MTSHAERTSPCLRVCLVDGRTHYCRGCGRTLHEIANWGRFTDAEREAVLAELPERPKAGRG
ncbi:MAG: DUF1289 domain-containing protein [Alphaproteobacteria bacterium]